MNEYLQVFYVDDASHNLDYILQIKLNKLQCKYPTRWATAGLSQYFHGAIYK